MDKVKRKYNARPGLPDKAALQYRPLTFFKSLLLPAAVDLRGKCSPVFDQGQIGSCTGNAIAGALEFLEIEALKESVRAPEVFNPLQFLNTSRLFIYWNERYLEGDTNADNGASISSGIKTINVWGICRESVWPYSPDNLFLRPSDECYKEAANHRGIASYLIDNSNIGTLKACLAGGNPFVFGISIWSSFEVDSVAKTGMVPMPDEAKEHMLGGHALMCVGYDDAKESFVFRNSWGTNWGNKGYGYIPYRYMTDKSLAWDFWTIRK